MITPVALTMAITGIVMIVYRGWDTLAGSRHWLEVGILLYVIAVVLAMAVQAPAGRKLVALTSAPPAPGTPPNPEIPATAKRLRVTGMVMTLLVVVIAFLMVVKPF